MDGVMVVTDDERGWRNEAESQRLNDAYRNKRAVKMMVDERWWWKMERKWKSEEVINSDGGT